jgi:hypothetical protein
MTLRVWESPSVWRDVLHELYNVELLGYSRDGTKLLARNFDTVTNSMRTYLFDHGERLVVPIPQSNEWFSRNLLSADGSLLGVGSSDQGGTISVYETAKMTAPPIFSLKGSLVAVVAAVAPPAPPAISAALPLASANRPLATTTSQATPLLQAGPAMAWAPFGVGQELRGLPRGLPPKSLLDRREWFRRRRGLARPPATSTR